MLFYVALALFINAAIADKVFGSTGEACQSACAMTGQSYFWCTTGIHTTWDYCHPQPNTTASGRPCADNHPCGLYNTADHWCWVDRNQTDWGYCSPQEQRPQDAAGAIGQCVDSHFCDKHDNHAQYWCYINDNGAWDTCDPNTPASTDRPVIGQTTVMGPPA